MDKRKNSIFRKTSLDNVASPEDLYDYIKVTSPGVWLILSAIIVFLAGVCIWANFGRMQFIVTAYGISDEGEFICYIDGEDYRSVKAGMAINVGEDEGKILSVSPSPLQASDILSNSILQKMEWKEDTAIYPIATDMLLPDGSYSVDIIVEDIYPVQLLFE